MKGFFRCMAVFMALAAITAPSFSQSAAKEGTDGMLANVQLMKQSTVRIAGERTVYLDPYQVSVSPQDGDIVFITHTHGDHLSLPDIRKVAKADALIVAPESAVKSIENAGLKNVVSMKSGDMKTIGGVKVEAVPAYNTNKSYHQKTSGWLGYIVTLNGIRYYHAGDTDVIPEMNGLKADVVFLPVGGTYTTTASEAADAANIIKPRAAVPMHYGDVVGSAKDAELFVSRLSPGIKGVILK